GDVPVQWVEDFYSGIERACSDFNVSLVGGDTSSAQSIFVDVSMIGRVPSGGAVRRSGAQVGDNIYVTGELGASAHGLQLLKSGDRFSANVQKHLYPTPRHRVGAAVRKQAHAMIDVSDGLSSDLTHILEESGVSAKIYREQIPRAKDASEADAL